MCFGEEEGQRRVYDRRYNAGASADAWRRQECEHSSRQPDRKERQNALAHKKRDPYEQ